MRTLILKTIILSLIIAAISILPSCRKEKTDPYRQQAYELFTKSVEISKSYIDSLAAAKDTASLTRICDRYDEMITKLNYKYSSEVALHISEGANDTLTHLVERFITMKDSMLVVFSKKPTATDSIPTDSLSSAQMAKNL